MISMHIWAWDDQKVPQKETLKMKRNDKKHSKSHKITWNSQKIMHSPHKRHKHMTNDNNDNKLTDHFVLQNDLWCLWTFI